MPPTTDDPQELRTKRAHLAVTPSEKQAIGYVAAVRQTDESNLLREMSVVEVVREYGRLAALARAAA